MTESSEVVVAGRARQLARAARLIQAGLDSGGALVLVYVVMFAVFALLSPYFLVTNNQLNMIASVSTLGIVAAVQTVVIISGGFDLSVGSTAALTSVVAAQLLVTTSSEPVAIVATLMVGVMIGMINALLITRLQVNPLIATLAMLSIVRGAALVWHNALTLQYPDRYLGFLGRDRIGDLVPTSVPIMLAVFLVVWIMLRYTGLGRFIYAVGGNPRAAFLAGIRVDRIRFIVYVASGFSAALAGLVIASQLIAGSPTAAQGLELTSITAAVLGGASLAGGQGRVWGTMVGALITGTLTNGLVLLGVSSFWQMIVLGIVLVIAVALDQFRMHAQP